MEQEPSLKEKTVNSMIWSFMDNIGTRVIQVAIQLLLARLLTPTDFGVLAMVVIFIEISKVFIDSGFTNGLIRDQNTSQEDYSTVFYYNVSLSILLYIILFVFSGVISRFFEVPELITVVRVLSIVLVIDAFTLVHRAILTKTLQFGIQMKVNLTSSLSSGLIAVILATLGFGMWSLIVKLIILQVVQFLLYTHVIKWKPSLVFKRSSFKRLFNFGSKLMISRLLNDLYSNVYSLIIGRGFSTASLGLYMNARNLNLMTSSAISTSLEKVSYPVLSNIQEDQDRLKNGFRKIFKSSLFITFPVILGLASIAPPLFRLLLGDAWIPSIPYFQILSFSGLFISVNMINLNILQVKGRSDLYLKVNIMDKILGFVVVFSILVLRLSIYGLLWGVVIHYLISYFINAAYSKKLIGYSIIDQMKDSLKISSISILMGVSSYSMNFIITDNDWLLIFIQCSVCVIVYFSLSFYFRVEELESIFQLVMPLQRKFFSGKSFMKN